MTASELEIAAITDPGVARDNNEDSIAQTPGLGLVVLADGMGGHQAGEVASGLAVDIISRHIANVVNGDAHQDFVTDSNSLENNAIDAAIRLANATIFETAQARVECAGMGSTVVVAMLHDNKISFGHVGDSRLYRMRGDELEQITEDHSVVQELLSRGLITPEEAHTAYNKNLVTKALGVEATVEPDVNELEFEANDIYLLCSDGLSDVLKDDTIAKLLGDSEDDLDHAVKHMVNIVNENGGPDNVSIILLRPHTNFSRSDERNSSGNGFQHE